MARDGAKEKLVDFLDRKAFRPVLEKSPDSYDSDADRRRLEHVQRATRDERERFEHYESAQKVYEMFRDDLSSDEAKDVQRDLKQLGLPTLRDVEPEFERLSRDLGIGR